MINVNAETDVPGTAVMLGFQNNEIAQDAAEIITNAIRR